MSAFNFDTSKLRPDDIKSWTKIPGTDRAVLLIQHDLGHDTVLVIDANDSMKEFWTDMAADAAQLANALMDKDKDGIDIFFPGVNTNEAEDHDSPAGGFLNVSNPLFLLEAFSQIEKAGFSKEEAVTDVVASIFKRYLDNYKSVSAEEKAEIKGLNVIVWTDGSFPQEPFEAVLVETANSLRDVGAPHELVGIQLLQVGNVDGVKGKFSYYDNGLQTAQGLDRDFVDHCVHEFNSFTPESITKISCGAVVKSQDEA